MILNDRPLFTQEYKSSLDFLPDPGSIYLYGILEERSDHIESLRRRSSNIRYVHLIEGGSLPASPEILIDDPASRGISLRRADALKTLVSSFSENKIYLDITGLSHHTWAPLTKIIHQLGRSLQVVYIEPAEYTFNKNPVAGEIFDLSAAIMGIAPVPLFVSLGEPKNEEICFIPLLGFEGARFAYMYEQVDPPGNKVFPIIGVPGFRAEYPFHTYLGNQEKLAESRAWFDVRYARANCPFCLFYLLDEIIALNSTNYIKIAPIGTKPHALGAVMQCIRGKHEIELVYDHPKRKPKRTSGATKCSVFAVSDFLISTP